MVLSGRALFVGCSLLFCRFVVECVLVRGLVNMVCCVLCVVRWSLLFGCCLLRVVCCGMCCVLYVVVCCMMCVVR